MDQNARSLRSHLTYANVMATIAVFIALSGSAYAAAKINGKNIKKSTVGGKALKKDTLGGREIKEASLGKVNQAASADSAQSAALATLATRASDADKTGGVTLKRINVKYPTSDAAATQTPYEYGALRLDVRCASGFLYPMMKLVSSADDGAAHAQRTTSSSTTVTVLNDDSLHAGDELNLVQGTVGSSTDFRFTLRNADGKSALVELNAALSYGPDGFQCRFIGVAFEV